MDRTLCWLEKTNICIDLSRGNLLEDCKCDWWITLGSVLGSLVVRMEGESNWFMIMVSARFGASGV